MISKPEYITRRIKRKKKEMKPKVRGADKGREGRETEKPGHLMSLNDPKWRYLLISSINFSCKISLARLARAYQPSDFTTEKRKKRKDIFEQLYLQ